METPTTIQQANDGKASVVFLRTLLDHPMHDAGQFPDFHGLLDVLSIEKAEFIDLLNALSDDFQRIREDHR